MTLSENANACFTEIKGHKNVTLMGLHLPSTVLKCEDSSVPSTINMPPALYSTFIKLCDGKQIECTAFGIHCYNMN